MALIDPSTALADLVTRRPELARHLDSLGLDYCCGGRQSLAGACAAAGLDTDAVVAELAETGVEDEPVDWADLGPIELCDHLEHTHHRYLREALPRIGELLEKVIAAHGEVHPELDAVRVVFSELSDELEPHLLKEERVLFPLIREVYESEGGQSLHLGFLESPIGVMSTEHDRAGDLLARLRAATGGYRTPSDGCASYAALYAELAELEADTHLHVHKENNLLFPAVLDL